MQPFYVQALLYGAALEDLAKFAVAAAVLVVAAKAISAVGAPGNEVSGSWGSFGEVEYVGAIALVVASSGVTELVVVLVADKVVADDATGSPRLGVEVDVAAADRAAVAEPRVPAGGSVEIVPVVVIERRVVVRVQASYLVQPWLASPFRFPVRYGLFAAAADYERW